MDVSLSENRYAPKPVNQNLLAKNFLLFRKPIHLLELRGAEPLLNRFLGREFEYPVNLNPRKTTRRVIQSRGEYIKQGFPSR